ncbi:UNVERIFIED_CONTAM: hypothetical protein ABID98_004215 [Brevibacillus sp. OAP136]
MAMTAKKLYASLFCLTLLLFAPVMVGAKEAPSSIITVTTSPDSPFCTTLEIKQPAWLAKRILRSRSVAAKVQPELPRAQITIGDREFVFDSYSQLFEPARQTQLVMSNAVRKQLEKWVYLAENAHYGQPLDWAKVKDDFARMDFATVTDLETGESFHVQRRAGSNHADVQPLTSEDTATMKRVYDGKWSWKRRAILLTIDGHTYAASMHGMPHGAGAIAGNNFPGHFCIHFQGSSTHRRNEPDPSHSLMILKASGKLKQELMQATPMRVVDIFLTSLHEHDRSTQLMTTANDFQMPFPSEELETFKRESEEWQNRNPDLLVATIPVELSCKWVDRREQKNTWTFRLERVSPGSRWKITNISLDEK